MLDIILTLDLQTNTLNSQFYNYVCLSLLAKGFTNFGMSKQRLTAILCAGQMNQFYYCVRDAVLCIMANDRLEAGHET